MGGLFGGQRTQVTNYSGLQVQSTTAMTPIPLLWGENMLTPTVIDYEGFHSKKKSSKSGGKGGTFASIFGGGGETIYYADVIMAFCEGPIGDVSAVYQTSSTAISLAQAGLALMAGNVGQAPWSYWTATYPTKALGYSGIAYAYASNFNLGPSATVGSSNCVVQGPLYGTGFNGVDADPALVIQDFLTNARYGAGLSGLIDTATLVGSSGDSSLQSYCHAAGLAFSPALTSREPGNAILARWLDLLNATCVWSSGRLRFFPRGDAALTGNGWTWTPDLTVRAIAGGVSGVV